MSIECLSTRGFVKNTTHSKTPFALSNFSMLHRKLLAGLG